MNEYTLFTHKQNNYIVPKKKKKQYLNVFLKTAEPQLNHVTTKNFTSCNI